MSLSLVERFAILKDKNQEPDILAAALNLKTRYLGVPDIVVLPNDVNFYPHGKTYERKIYGLNILFNSYENGNKIEYEMSIEYKQQAVKTGKSKIIYTA